MECMHKGKVIMAKKKETVLMVHNYYQIPGGEDTVVANEKKLLEEHGHKVILYTRDNSELNKLSILDKMLLPLNTVFSFRTFREIRRLIKDNDIDIVHVHNTLNMISPSVFYAAVSCKVPVVQTLHNFRMICPNAIFYRGGRICEDCLDKGLMCAVKHGCYRGSKLQTLAIVISTLIHRKTGIYKKVNFICLTDFNKEKLLQLNRKKRIADESKIFVKPNFTFDIDTVDSNNIKQTSDYYLFVGRLEEIKGIWIIKKAFSYSNNDIKIKMAGTGSQTTIKKLKQNNIELLGQVDREELIKYLTGAKALIVASQLYEGLPMNIMEAYACGLPVIAGDIGNMSNLVDDGITGRKFIYNDPKSLLKCITEYEALSPEEIDKMKAAARSKFMELYNPESSYGMLENIYGTVMKPR
jgi:glycosyltransferase involved in cell wall biosynthesis